MLFVYKICNTGQGNSDDFSNGSCTGTGGFFGAGGVVIGAGGDGDGAIAADIGPAGIQSCFVLVLLLLVFIGIIDVIASRCIQLLMVVTISQGKKNICEWCSAAWWLLISIYLRMIAGCKQQSGRLAILAPPASL